MKLRLARKVAAAGRAFRWATVDASVRRLGKATSAYWKRQVRVWTPPTITEAYVCYNCDADTDDGEWKARHAVDILCVFWGEA